MPRHGLIFLVAALVALLAVPPASAAQAPRKKSPKLTVMTRNVYLGGNIALPIGSQTREEFEQRNTVVFDTVIATDFPARAKLLAREVAGAKPDLIGLQEVALWRTGPKDDPAAATKVRFDFLRLLRAELRRRGLRYRVGSVQPEADVEGPTTDYGDVRLTMRDVVLVKRRKGLRVVRRGGKNFKARLSVPTPVGALVSKRGYAFVDVALKGRRLRFIDTHLEAFSGDLRLDQAKELIARRGPARTRLPLILLGDLNSDAEGDPDGEGDPKPYRALRRFGFKDAWTQINPRKDGFACCLEGDDLLDPPPFGADHRIDHVLVKQRKGGRGTRLRGLRARTIGLDPGNRTDSGLWPSDHGGVVAVFRLP